MPKKSKKRGKKSRGRRQKANAVDEAIQKEKLLTLFFQDKLKKEERNTAMNRLKLIDVWRTIQRQKRATELQAETNLYKQDFEKQLNMYDSVIEKVLQEVKDTEHQIADVRRAHMLYLQHLQEQHDERLKNLEQQWEDITDRVHTIVNCEREETLVHLQEHSDKLQQARHSMEQSHKEEMIRSQEVYDDLQVHHEDLSHLPERIDDKGALQAKLLFLEKLITLLAKKTEKNNRSRKIIEQLQTASQHLKKKLARAKLVYKLHLEELKEAIDDVKGMCFKLHDRLQQSRTDAKNRITRLTVLGDEAIKKLKADINKGEKILLLAGICSKLENQLNISALRSSLSTEDSTQALNETLNAAVLQRQAALQHRDALYKENQQLRYLVRQHVEHGTVYGGCAPFTVSHAPTFNVPQPAERHHPVIDGCHAIRHAL